MEAINPIQKERQVTQLKGFFSFLLGNLLIKNWKNSCSANANPLSHKADNAIISFFINCFNIVIFFDVFMKLRP